MYFDRVDEKPHRRSLLAADYRCETPKGWVGTEPQSRCSFPTIASQLLIFLSAWHRSDEVCDRAVAYFFWIVKNYTIWYMVNNMLIEHEWLNVGGWG
jgi:hypothetical protein